MLRFNRADDRRLQRWLVFFQIQGNLLVAGLPHQWADEEVPDQSNERQTNEDAERDDRGGSKAPRFQAVCRGKEHQHANANDSQRTTQRQLHAPSPSHLMDDLNQLRGRIRASIVVSHKPGSPGVSLTPPRSKARSAIATIG